MPSNTITHRNGQTTHYIDDDFTDPWKPHEVILIQHGFARHSAFWYHWVPILSRQYRVIRRDARGHGRSSYPTPGQQYDYSLDTILAEIIDLLDQLDISKVHFLGESTSGMIGEALAARYPERLHSLILCSAPPYLPPQALELFAFGHPDWPTACRQLGSRGWGLALSRLPGTIAVPDDDGYIRWWVDQVAVSEGEGLAGYANFLSSLDGRPFLSAIKLPTLILAPKHSAATSVADQTALSHQIAGSKLVVVDAPGHEIYVSSPDQCQREVLHFLASLPKNT